MVIDESHNFRNGGKIVDDDDGDSKLNRYAILMKKVIQSGVRTKVLMLSATPVNNKFLDLKINLPLLMKVIPITLMKKLNTKRSIDDIFKNAQKRSTYGASGIRPKEQLKTC